MNLTSGKYSLDIHYYLLYIYFVWNVAMVSKSIWEDNNGHTRIINTKAISAYHTGIHVILHFYQTIQSHYFQKSFSFKLNIL